MLLDASKSEHRKLSAITHTDASLSLETVGGGWRFALACWYVVCCGFPTVSKWINQNGNKFR